ncbi:MAG: carboxypeptidase M32 [Phycisphaerae bacterium]|nr:carboxypeptidase M32 [Phycisphaerae bacterium]
MTAQKSVSATPYLELCSILRDAATLGSISALLNWDQETYMPPAGSAARADQQSLMAALVHQRRTDPRVGELLAKVEGDKSLTSDPDSETARNIVEMRREYDLATKLPTDLVAELAKTTSLAQEAWKAAREASDFAQFAPWLERVMALTRRKAECYGVPAGGELYDALLDEYEPGMSAREVEAIFAPLRPRLAGLVAAIATSSKQLDRAVLRKAVPAAQQTEWCMAVLKAIGFDLEAGRLDVTTHPFCSGLAPGDTRLTFRHKTESFLEPLYGVLHEAGHGMYEQGLPKSKHFGEPLADAISLGIHESQSRMWENFVGRSREFWSWAFPIARRTLAPHLDGMDEATMHRAANLVTPSFIRVEADEATYNLHIMLRFGLERGLVSGALPVRDLPGEWNKTFKQFLGLDVPDDRRGCLQDVHWSFGLVGYFPTYTLGNLYAAQFWETINQQIPDLNARMGRGDFAALKQWLNTNIHACGKRWRAAELCRRVTGKALSADPLMRHLEGRLKPLYGI